MNPEERKVLYEAARLAEENNKILRGMRRSARYAFIWKVIYWGIILGLAYQSYIWIEPYVTTLLKTYSDLQKNMQSVSGKFPTLPANAADFLKR